VALEAFELLRSQDRLELGHHGIRQRPHLLLRAPKRLCEPGCRTLHDFADLSPLLFALRLHGPFDELDDPWTGPDPGETIHASIVQHSADEHPNDDSEDQNGQEEKG
jgi:hypothetical protein